MIEWVIASAPGHLAALAAANATAVAWHRRAEAPYYPGVRARPDDGIWPPGLPRLCVALSSGGTAMLDVAYPFPKDSLLRLGYEPDRFRVYRELGRFVGAERLAPVLIAEPD